MRVLIINREDALSNFGGDTVQMVSTADALRALGVDVSVELGAQDGATMRRFDVVHLFNIQTFRFTHSMLMVAKEAGVRVAVSPIWWDFRADDVMRVSPKWRMARRLLGTARTRRMVQKRIEPIVHGERQYHRDILAGADVLFPNSKIEGEHLRELCRFETPICVVPNGIDPDAPVDMEAGRVLLTEHGLSEKGFILVAGRVEEVKNQLAFGLAVRGLGLPVVCAGAIHEPYGSLCLEAGLILLGKLERPVLQGMYRLARLHALPSFRETPGLASLEAAAAGCGIVSTDVGSARDYFGEFAAYCDPHDRSSMRQATERGLDFGDGAAFAAHVRGNFTWRQAAEATVVGYRALVG